MTVRLMRGNNLELLAELPEQHVHAIVTSPPYWGLRCYGTPPIQWPAVSYSPMPGLPEIHIPAMESQMGLEPTLEAFIGHMVHTFRLARRVLRDDGVAWVNMGDSYASGGRTSRDTASTNKGNAGAMQPNRPQDGLKPKDLVGQPWRVAFALQADGWWLRQDVIWSKPNPMPESIRDRCTKAHEFIFLLAKRERYYWNFDAIQEPVSGGAHARKPTVAGWAGAGTPHNAVDHAQANAWQKQGVGHRAGPPGNPAPRKLAQAGSGTKNNESFDEAMAEMPDARNPRSVWTVPTEPFKEAHFATYPPALIETCIKASVPPGGTVLDMFGGSGTTGLVADRLQRDAILMELNPSYADIAQRRVSGDAPLFVELTA